MVESGLLAVVAELGGWLLSAMMASEASLRLVIQHVIFAASIHSARSRRAHVTDRLSAAAVGLDGGRRWGLVQHVQSDP